MWKKTWIVIASLAIAGCSKKDGAETSPSASATMSAPTSAPATTSVAPAATSATPPPDRADCPKGSKGPGTFDKPCLASGTTRMMDVAWTGKTDDKGPQFRVTNKSPTVILYGHIVVYFYDKAGKQLDVKDETGKTHPNRACGGNIFGGVMKAGEKAVLTFSCVKKSMVPEGTAAIEGEMQTVGFTKDSEEKSDLFWRNNDITPDTRKKGGVK